VSFYSHCGHDACPTPPRRFGQDRIQQPRADTLRPAVKDRSDVQGLKKPPGIRKRDCANDAGASFVNRNPVLRLPCGGKRFRKQLSRNGVFDCARFADRKPGQALALHTNIGVNRRARPSSKISREA
jgi:hypothetical protein